MHRFCVAPMMGYTDACCRRLFRSLTQSALLYSEMITTHALLHGDSEALLAHHADGPVALQLGGSVPEDLAVCARLGAEAGYQEINLNVGCPSSRVQAASIGAALMASPALVAACLTAMREAVSIPVTIKHRISLEGDDCYDTLWDFVDALYRAGTRVFIVHARTAYLTRYSPRDNRQIPPLRYEFVYSLHKAFPEAEIVLNGGLGFDWFAHASQVSGVMIGRYAYHQPWDCLSVADQYLEGEAPRYTDQMAWLSTLPALVAQENPYVCLRHLLSAAHGLPGARHWRRHLSQPGAHRREDWPVIVQEAYARLCAHAH